MLCNVHCVLGLAVWSDFKESVDSCLKPIGSSNCLDKKPTALNFYAFYIILFILIIHIIFQVTALLEKLEFQESAKHKGSLAVYKCLVLGHTKYNGVQRIPTPFTAVIAWTWS